MPSFDVVSEIDQHELTNAIDQANREISNRFDFKGTDSKIDKVDGNLTIISSSEFQVKQIQEILEAKITKRSIDIRCLDYGDIVENNNEARQVVNIQKGVGKELARKIVKMIKTSKLKTQAAIQGEQVRITGKKRDDLQQTIAEIKTAKFDVPLQYINFRAINSKISKIIMSTYPSIDLHAHSTASDGELSPTDLVGKAVENGVDILALTDHDTVAGLAEAQEAATEHEITLINGIELSTRWDNKTIHVVGLNIKADNKNILNATIHLNKLRIERAIKIGERLEKVGIKNAYENTKNIAGNGTVTRQHFAQFLVNNGHAKSIADVFKRFLVNNKPGYVSVNWPSLEETISNISSAGGVAVIAHPLRYKMTATKLRKLISEFKDTGGKAIEVVTGNNNQNEINTATNYAKRYDIAASVGSDYHNSKTPWAQLGKLTVLPQGLTPVWDIW